MLAYGDIQGTILQGYRVDHARHFALRVEEGGGARRFLGALVDETSKLPQITTARRWDEKPASFLNVGITATGLTALGVPVGGFPRAFKRGATSETTLDLIGDVDVSAPSHWVTGFRDGARVDLILSLWVHEDVTELQRVSAILREGFGTSLVELTALDASALPDNKVHFGYTDSISQPTVEGAPESKRPMPDHQPVVPTGEFVLGHPRRPNGPPDVYDVTPKVLSKNSSFAVFRMLEQDVAGFEAWLAATSKKEKMEPELLAAKVCGRWRSGVPLVLSPDRDLPAGLPDDQINDYDYVSSDPLSDDTFGYKCPIGSHMRRTNPRGQQVEAGGGSQHRIIRRAMPYGPPYDPAKPDEGARGLVGWFINADITNQFELIMDSWVNKSSYVVPVDGPGGADPSANISGQDMLLGVNTDPEQNSFTLSHPPRAGMRVNPKTDNKPLTGFKSFVCTRASAYCYLPSVKALRWIGHADPRPPS